MNTVTQEPSVRTSDVRVAPRSRLSVPMAIMGGAAWVVFLGIALVVQPASSGDPVPTLAGELIGLVLWGSLLAAAFGLVIRVPLGLTATAVGGLAIVAGAGYCYLDGHTGAWIAAQMGAGAGMAGFGAIARRFA